MKFVVRIAIALEYREEENPENPFDRIYDAEIEAESAMQACDIAIMQTNRIYPDAFIATTVKELT